MKKCRITVKRISCYKDLMEQYENPISNACDMKEGQVFIANGWKNRMIFVIAHGTVSLLLS